MNAFDLGERTFGRNENKVNRRIVFVHTVPPLIDVFDALCTEILPDAKVFHVLDEPLLERVRSRGRLAPEDSLDLDTHVRKAEDIGADAVLVSCSTLSPAVDHIARASRVPVLKIDEEMIRAAVQLGGTLSVLATSETTLEPTREMIEAEATRTKTPVEIRLCHVRGALQKLLDGDSEAHDRLVGEAVEREAGASDVILFAQASMARAEELAVQRAGGKPVLSSPRMALESLRALLETRKAE